MDRRNEMKKSEMLERIREKALELGAAQAKLIPAKAPPKSLGPRASRG